MNKNDDDKESVVRISLLDVMYGVVLAYGFNFFDKAEDCTDYFRFFFAIAVFVVDWVYVHSIYWEAEYKKNFFLMLDIGILFSISRLLSTSTASTPNYFLWLSMLFILYVFWGIMVSDKLPSRFDWHYGYAGDGCAAVLFFLFWISSITKQFFLFRIVSMIASITKLSESFIMTVLALIVYFLIVKYTWFKKAPK